MTISHNKCYKTIENNIINTYSVYMILKELFGRNLKKIRESKALTQEQLAELIGLQPNSVGQIEMGRKAVSFKTLEKLQCSLNESYYELFDFEEVQTSNSLTKSIIRELDGLDNKYLKYILNTIKEFKKVFKL